MVGKKNNYIGMMTGTSLDGTDIVYANFTNKPPIVLAHQHFPLTKNIKTKTLSIYENPNTTINFLQSLHQEIGMYYAMICNDFLQTNNIPKEDVSAIGCHGITVDHQPNSEIPYSLQLGCGHQLAFHTSINTVTDFRMRDIVSGGQGAPLAPIFHQEFFSNNKEDIIVVNIGGIANASIISCDGSYFGFDTGPGNRLMDDWCKLKFNKDFDVDGVIAATGNINYELLNRLLKDEYFDLPIPKSTGREYFNLTWLIKFIKKPNDHQAEDILATLTALTAHSIAYSLKPYLKSDTTITLCGGGVNNKFLVQLLQQLMPQHHIVSSDTAYNISSQQIESLGFAYLAKLNLEHIKVSTNNATKNIIGVLHAT